jgi:hypothetical protein
MRAQPELVAAQLQLVLALLAERKLLILTTKKTVTHTMQLQPLKALLLRPKLQLLLLLKVRLRQPKLQLLHLQRKLQLLKLQLRKRSSLTVRCI